MTTVPPQPRMLGSWKEIASYLGKGVRTVQRWERHFGLPVRRPNAATKGVVCASPDELDLWFQTHWGQRAAKSLPVDGEARKAVHASLQTSLQLRHTTERLVSDVMRSVRGVAQECQALAGQSGRHPKSHSRR